MQNYSYSVFSIVAIAIHLIINFDLMFRRGKGSVCPPGYRGFLFGTLAYYATDAAWGVFAGLHWLGSWYADSVFFFLSLVAFVWMWANFVVSYLRLGKRASRLVRGYGAALLAFNLAALAANPFTDCFFSFDADGVYHTGIVRDVAFALLVAYNVLLAALVLVEILRNRDDVRKHELGHRTQSRMLGPLYLLVVGIPSAILCTVARFSPYISRTYDEHFPENWANRLGGVTGEPATDERDSSPTAGT